jgi:hypothetical protein
MALYPQKHNGNPPGQAHTHSHMAGTHGAQSFVHLGKIPPNQREPPTPDFFAVLRS